MSYSTGHIAFVMQVLYVDVELFVQHIQPAGVHDWAGTAPCTFERPVVQEDTVTAVPVSYLSLHNSDGVFIHCYTCSSST